MAKKIIIGSTEVVVPLKSDISQQIKDEAQLPSLVFTDQAELEAWILDGSTEHDGFLPSDLSVGQTLYTLPASEPDFWVVTTPVESMGDLEVLGSDASNIQTTLPYTEKETLDTTDELYVYDGTPKHVTQANLLKGVVPKTDIINNLTSSDTNKPLSALQGKQLNDFVSKGGYFFTVNTLWTVIGSISKDPLLQGGSVMLGLDKGLDDSSEPMAGILQITSTANVFTMQWFVKHRDIDLENFAYYDNGTNILILAKDNDDITVVWKVKVLMETFSFLMVTPSTSPYFTLGDGSQDTYTPDGYSIMMEQDLVYQTDLNDYILKTDIANNLTTTDAGKVLDARQGKALDDKKLDKVTSSSSFTRIYYVSADGTTQQTVDMRSSFGGSSVPLRKPNSIITEVSGNTATRPSTGLSPGDQYFNTQRGQMEIYIGDTNHWLNQKYSNGDTLPTPASGTSHTYLVVGSGNDIDNPPSIEVGGVDIYDSTSGTLNGATIIITNDGADIKAFNVAGSLTGALTNMVITTIGEVSLLRVA